MKYIVVASFKDLQDNDFIYKVGDFYPRVNRKIEDVSEERIQQLTTKNNARKRVLIKKLKIEEPKVEETAEPEATEEPKVEETAEPEQTEESKANTNAKNTRKRN